MFFVVHGFPTSLSHEGCITRFNDTANMPAAKIVPGRCRLAGAKLYCAGRWLVFGPLGMPEIIMIFIVGLLLFGPRKMPELGRSIGRALGEFCRASNEFKRTVEDEVAAEDIRAVEKDLREIKNAGADAVKTTIDAAVKEPPKEQGDS
ncbi:MAG: twin-arginine translocase TatA/TatE family subunit [Candidatus Aminicenantes bacterium]|nr:MAG: twin-arginine translocase TatA/TatE family subunit [Candidatus Aminicenantes bacterium]